jgi:hypothetical protein
MCPQHVVLEVGDEEFEKAGEDKGKFAIVELHIGRDVSPSTSSYPRGTIGVMTDDEVLERHALTASSSSNG